MNITQLLYFINVVSYNFNISNAADNLHVSQSTVSKAITSFEEQGHVKLFVRRGHKIIGLTVRGRSFLRDARRVIHDYHRLMVNVHDSTNITGTITVGIASAIYDTFFSRILIPLRQHHPHVRIKTQVLGSEQLQDQLILGKIDLAYIAGPVKYSLLKAIPLVQGSAAIIFNPKYYSIAPKLQLDWLASQNLALLDHSFTLRTQIDTIFRLKKRHLRVTVESNSENFLINTCRYNKVITILPESTIYGYNFTGLTVASLSQITWKLFAVTLPSNPNPVVDIIRQDINAAITEIDHQNKQTDN